MKLFSNPSFRRLQSSLALRFMSGRKLATPNHRGVLNRLLIVAILISYVVPGPVQAQHADLAKMKVDAQKIVHVIGGEG